jgi:cytochrome c oxidase cbb3-type subunit 3
VIGPEHRLVRADPNAVPNDPALMGLATRRGKAVYAQACAACHGAGARGDSSLGVPDLGDQDWLYGTGSPAEIERTVAYGIRSRYPKAWNLAAMPAYARPVPLLGQALPTLTPDEIHDLAEFLVNLEDDAADPAASDRGARLFNGAAGCYDCHSSDARGDPAIGAPDLADRIWLYGDGSRASIADSISFGRQGVCPAQIGRLSPAEIREVTLYVYDLSHPALAKKAE